MAATGEKRLNTAAGEPDMAPRKRLAIVVKYYHPLERISGIISYLTDLTRVLARKFDLRLITFKTGHDHRTEVRRDGYLIHRVPAPFPVAAALKLREIDPWAAVVVSGFYRHWLAIPYFSILNAAAPRHVPMIFYQATNVAAPTSDLHRFILWRYARVLCGSPSVLKAFRSLPPERVVLLPPAVDTARLESVKPAPGGSRFRIGFVNHFNHVKGADIALRIFAGLELDDTEMVAAGTGELEKELRSRYRNHPKIRFAGFLPEMKRLSLIKSCDAMLLPFRTGVSVLGVSQTVLECMALGTVVVGSDTSAIRPAIEPDTDGFIFASEEEAAQQLRGLYDRRQQREAVSEAALHKVRAHYDIESAAGTLVRTLEEATAR